MSINGHMVTTPKTPEWLMERAAFVKKWAEIEAGGLAKGFLDYGLCHECAGTVDATTNTEDHVWVFDEGEK